MSFPTSSIVSAFGETKSSTTTSRNDAAADGRPTLLTSLFEPPNSLAQIRPEERTSVTNINESTQLIESTKEISAQLFHLPSCCQFPSASHILSTLMGAFTMLLYHIVFCLAQASTVAPIQALTGALAQRAALGVLLAAPSFIWQVSDKIPALYPATDLFLAPFLADMAYRVHTIITSDESYDDDGRDGGQDVLTYDFQKETDFLVTFTALLATGLFVSGLLCWTAARIRLANFASFLPYPVLTGFFSTIGILMWTLGFSVDTGSSVGAVLLSRDAETMTNALMHHAPSLVVGLLMHFSSRKLPYLVMVWILVTIIFFYATIFALGSNFQEAQDNHWFFTPEELQGSSNTSSQSMRRFNPPWPFAWCFRLQHVVPQAYLAGLPTCAALAFLYLLRCSLHAAALKKNVKNLSKGTQRSGSDSSMQHMSVEDDEDTSSFFTPKRRNYDSGHMTVPALKPVSLGYLLEHGYAYSQWISALSGGISVAPSLAASLTLVQLGASDAAPQYGSCLLLLYFYVTDFQLVQYIPKPVFSSLMVLAGLDMFRTWMIESYFKTKAKAEWLVAPVLVVLAFCVGLLNAIFIGIGISTFLFVTSFYRAGTVKFVGNGLTLRSPVERGMQEAGWLDQNGDLIQILVLQNYLFFGNAQSVLNYVSTMFEENPVILDAPDTDGDLPLPPIPKYLVIDFILVTGMDTSAVDLFGEIVQLCLHHHCQLFLSGMPTSLKTMLLYAGVKPQDGSTFRRRQFFFSSDLESALAKAEDGLLSTDFRLEEKDTTESANRRLRRSRSHGEDGFIYALKKIDEQHGLDTEHCLKGLEPYVETIELQAGEHLVRAVPHSLSLDEEDGGIYFVETGLLRIRHSSAALTTLNLHSVSNSMDPRQRRLDGGALAPAVSDNMDPTSTIGNLNARSGKLGLKTALWKEQRRNQGEPITEQSFRLARIGQGWIVGSIEASNGLKRPGVHVAMTQCRLHRLSRNAISKLEVEDPTTAMHLYRTLAHLSTKRQEMTIDQLNQFVRILQAPTPRLRNGKKDLARLHNPEFALLTS